MTDPTGWQVTDTELFLRYGDAFVPRRAEQFATICALLDPLPYPRVLELGCGAGLLTAVLLNRMPTVTVTAVDASAEMVALARARLGTFGDRVTVDVADLTDQDWRSGTWGAVVTSLAVHHLDDAKKQDLFRAVYDLLVPGGLFVQADMFLPATAATVAVAAGQWDALVEAQSQAEYGDARAYDAFHSARWNTFHHPDPVDQIVPLADQLRWLTEAGFAGVDVAWALVGHAVLTATRPGPAVP
ncbi:class I SAM-dependent methyltransferase [Micromonospora sp. NPDC049645]|uniref:class I SAM-dependent methyltransferase n=1 Tax=Micromonospora sp. NPDC049645 TaxID=3155508 RepID=UPI003442CAD2